MKLNWWRALGHNTTAHTNRGHCVSSQNTLCVYRVWLSQGQSPPCTWAEGVTWRNAEFRLQLTEQTGHFHLIRLYVSTILPQLLTSSDLTHSHIQILFIPQFYPTALKRTHNYAFSLQDEVVASSQDLVNLKLQLDVYKWFKCSGKNCVISRLISKTWKTPAVELLKHQCGIRPHLTSKSWRRQ